MCDRFDDVGKGSLNCIVTFFSEPFVTTHGTACRGDRSLVLVFVLVQTACCGCVSVYNKYSNHGVYVSSVLYFLHFFYRFLGQRSRQNSCFPRRLICCM